MKDQIEQKSFAKLTEQARDELHFVDALFGSPVYRDRNLTFSVKNFCITEDNPINRTGQPLWIRDGVIECLGVISSTRVIVPHIQKGEALEFGEQEKVTDVPPSSVESSSPDLVTFELEGRMESPRAGVLSWVIKCSSVNLVIND